jgi:hypothetical protein
LEYESNTLARKRRQGCGMVAGYVDGPDGAFLKQLELDFAMKFNTDQKAWDAFAAVALTGMSANPEAGCNSPRDFAHWAGSVADAMMKERAKRMVAPACEIISQNL